MFVFPRGCFSMIIIPIGIYLALCLLVGRWALSLKRNGNTYMFSLLMSNMIKYIIVAWQMLVGISHIGLYAKRMKYSSNIRFCYTF
jgi:hypothetical protein